MKQQKTTTLFIMVVIGIVMAICLNGVLSMCMTAIYIFWVMGMACIWHDEGKLDILNSVEE